MQLQNARAKYTYTNKFSVGRAFVINLSRMQFVCVSVCVGKLQSESEWKKAKHKL